MKKISLTVCFGCLFLFAQENVIFKTLQVGETFAIQINLDFSDDILVLSRLENDFFTNVSSSRSQDTVEFSLTARKSGKTTISIDNVSQNLANFLTYQVTIEGPLTEGKLEAPKKSNQLLVREAYLRAKEVIDSGLWEIAVKGLNDFKNNFSDAKKEYWLLVKNLYEAYRMNDLKSEANALLREYLQDEEQFPFLDEAKLLLAKEEASGSNFSAALTLLFDIDKKSTIYRSSLLEKGRIYQKQRKNQSALNAYLDYLANEKENHSPKQLAELLPVLLEVGELYENTPINDFQKALFYYQELHKKAKENNDFAMQEKALNKIFFLEKHYIDVK